MNIVIGVDESLTAATKKLAAMAGAFGMGNEATQAEDMIAVIEKGWLPGCFNVLHEYLVFLLKYFSST
jgi:hypothetical protein